jgi:REP element-mobilizing transposase RayT
MNAMPRFRRYCPGENPQHVILRCKNRCDFFSADDYLVFYAHCVDEAAQKHGLTNHGWVLMKNHVHVLVMKEPDGSLSDLTR